MMATDLNPHDDEPSAVAEGPELAAEGLTCYSCGETLREGGEVCPRCQRRQTRVCFCGNKIAATAATCPHCGADWRRSLRVSRRRHRRVMPLPLARAAAAGSGIALLFGAVGAIMVDSLARPQLPRGTSLPVVFSERAALAGQAITNTLGSIVHALALHAGGLVLLIALAGFGALVGAFFYLGSEGLLRSRLLPRYRPQGTRVRRRRQSRFRT